VLYWISRKAKAEVASLLDQAVTISSNALTIAHLVFMLWAASLDGISKNYYRISSPMPMKSAIISEIPV